MNVSSLTGDVGMRHRWLRSYRLAVGVCGAVYCLVWSVLGAIQDIGRFLYVWLCHVHPVCSGCNHSPLNIKHGHFRQYLVPCIRAMMMHSNTKSKPPATNQAGSTGVAGA
jgi:hypothetical protein